MGSVSTSSAPISFRLLLPALTASQVPSTGPGAFPASSPLPPTPSPTETHVKWVLLLSPLYGGGNGLRQVGPLASVKQWQILFLNPLQCPGQSHPRCLPIMVALSQPSSSLSLCTNWHCQSLSSLGSWEPASPCSFLPLHRVGSPEFYPWHFTCLMIENLPRETLNAVETSCPLAQGHSKSVAGRVS